MAKSQKPTSGALADHKKVGKKFVPPFIAQLGPLQEIRWLNDLVPELIWIALLHSKHGLKAGADLARQTALAALGAGENKSRKWFALASSYAELDAAQRAAVIAALQSSRALDLSLVDEMVRRGLSKAILVTKDKDFRGTTSPVEGQRIQVMSVSGAIKALEDVLRAHRDVLFEQIAALNEQRRNLAREAILNAAPIVEEFVTEWCPALAGPGVDESDRRNL